ncbi:Hypothetical predicted protein [Olea europaea subsp. europaea]|uniref:Uncharacterized protein n=1 Tax=Olea europaea subsp. europaea TaxID=158383 RepID=A0A8S0T446_OLEEU|nr:Hypothetical predicted protein [Olea europaea subsp. europaea]
MTPVMISWQHKSAVVATSLQSPLGKESSQVDNQLLDSNFIVILPALLSDTTLPLSIIVHLSATPSALSVAGFCTPKLILKWRMKTH